MKASVTDSTLQKMNGKPSEAGPSGESITEPACVLIPAGWFQMGCETGQDEEKPVHRVWVDAVEMAGVQVRNRDFAVFLQSTGHPAPPHWNDPDLNHPDQPVVAVSWFEAGQYCEWFGRQNAVATLQRSARAEFVCVRLHLSFSPDGQRLANRKQAPRGKPGARPRQSLRWRRRRGCKLTGVNQVSTLGCRDPLAPVRWPWPNRLARIISSDSPRKMNGNAY